MEPYAGCKPDIQLSDIMSRPETAYSAKWINHLVQGTLQQNGAEIPVLDQRVVLKDLLGAMMVRMGIHRMGYHFPPGLYFVGASEVAKTGAVLPVIVSCNYKLTLDALRGAINQEAYWLLILDTKGVNVWCAAGKGTFGTEELIFQLTKNRVKEVTGNGTIILPQLGASRMTPQVVSKLTGLKIVYGPVRAEDLDDFINQGFTATEAQRTVNFSLKERLVLTPVELIMQLKYLPIVIVLMLFYNMLWGTGHLNGLVAVSQTLPWLIAWVTGAVLFPAALPLLPFRAFSLKSLALSLPMVILIGLNREFFQLGSSIGGLLALSLAWMTAIAYTALNFTGSTTFTSLSGVDYEVAWFKKMVPVIGVVSAVLLITGIWV